MAVDADAEAVADEEEGEEAEVPDADEDGDGDEDGRIRLASTQRLSPQLTAYTHALTTTAHTTVVPASWPCCFECSCTSVSSCTKPFCMHAGSCMRQSTSGGGGIDDGREGADGEGDLAEDADAEGEDAPPAEAVNS